MSLSLIFGTFQAGSSIYGLGFNLYKHLSARANGSKGHQKLIVRELRNNILLLDKRDVGNVDIKHLIDRLSNKEIVDGIRENYNLNRLSMLWSVVHPTMVFRPYDKDYVNWKMSRVMESIDEKIEDLQQISAIDKDIDNSSFNLTAKLNNLFFLCLIAALMTRRKFEVQEMTFEEWLEYRSKNS
jgi:hypothetical protein